VSESDVVITTAVIPGKKSPILVTGEMVQKMAPGSVIVDLAAERGGNCELTVPGEISIQHDVTIVGLFNLASTVPYHASQMYAKNVATFLLHLVKDGTLRLDTADEIIRDTWLTDGGEIVNKRLRELYSLPALAVPAAASTGTVEPGAPTAAGEVKNEMKLDLLTSLYVSCWRGSLDLK